MFLFAPPHRQIANEIANKSAGAVKSKTKYQAISKLFSKYISISDLLSKRIESKKFSISKFIVDEYS